jgi:amino acid transporter
VYVLLTIGLPVYFVKNHRAEFAPVRHVLIPLVSLVGLGLVTWGNTYPLPPSPLRYFVYAVAAVVVVLVVIANWLARRHADLLSEAGRLLA